MSCNINSETNRVEVSTHRWLTDIVIGLGFCPFAAGVMGRPGAVAVEVVAGGTEQRLQWLLDSLHKLRLPTRTETVLMVMPEGLEDFETFLDFADLAEGVLELHGFSGEFQLATFHPEYLFADSEQNDAANYTNRSPYPTLHILREEQLGELLENFAEPQSIPERNIEYARDIGSKALAEHLENCFTDSADITKQGEPDNATSTESRQKPD